MTRESTLNEGFAQSRRAIQDYRLRRWQCEYEVNESDLPRQPADFAFNLQSAGAHPPRASGRRLRCQNYLETHDKGHQFRSAIIPPHNNPTLLLLKLFMRPRFQSGPFVGDFDLDACMVALREQTHSAMASPSFEEAHRNLAPQCNLSRLQSNVTCLGCLTRRPIRTLACGHMLCERCVSLFGQHDQLEDYKITVAGCPFGHTAEDRTFVLKPRNAGIRTLTFDG